MTYNIETIKNILITYVDESSQNRNQNKNQFILPILELEKIIGEIKKENGIKTSVDNSILTLLSPEKIKFGEAFAPVNYQYSFLYFLAETADEKYSLVFKIDKFIQKIIDHLSLKDIELTNSGATRCKTNLRFAYKALSELGLILHRDYNDKKVYTPSILGLIVLLNIKLNPKERKNANCIPIWDRPTNFKSLDDCGGYDRGLINAKEDFRQPEKIYLFLDQIKENALSKEEKEIISEIMNDYVDFTQDGLEITLKGITHKENFKELSKAFRKKILTLDRNNIELYNKLLNHFNLKND